MTGITIEKRDNFTRDSEIDALFKVYQETFSEINTLAVQRHTLTYGEFVAVLDEPAIDTYLAHDEGGRVVGMSVATKHLGAWPLISPAYFARHYPELYERDAIWYIGFVMAVEGAPAGVFPALVAEMLKPIREGRGIGVLDFCAHNMINRKLGRATTEILRRLEPSATGRVIDSQDFVAYSFDWPEQVKCSCAMSEATTTSCPVHGYDAPEL